MHFKNIIFKKLKTDKKIFNNTDLKNDLFWNYGSLIFLAISGLGINFFISQFYGTSTLGVFNQVLSIYIVFSVFGSGGINYSVLRSLSEYRKNEKIIKSIIKGSIIPGVFLSSLATIIFSLSINFFSKLLGSEEVGIGLKLVIPAIFFFSLNKIFLLGILNGLRRMKAFAFFQSLRYILIFLGLLISIFIKLEGIYITYIFSFSEIILFLFLVIEISNKIKWWQGDNYIYWARNHFLYGVKAIWSGIFTEMNSKVDVIMIGIFMSDEKVGIYSFAAFCIEGILQIFVVLQNNFNPIIASYLSGNEIIKLEHFIYRSKNLTYRAMLLITLISISVYPLLIKNIPIKNSLSESILPFIILNIGILISSGYIPFNNIFSMANLPSWHSIYMMINILSNVILNYILIPNFGIIGASIATSISFVCAAFLLKFGSNNLIRLNI